MFTESADLYDLIYSFKDYRKESEEIIAAIKAKRPACKSVLDIGCGTGAHHQYLKDRFQVDGLDINEAFITTACARNPEGSYYVADMMDFNLNKKYDAVICLFSSIGYVKTFDQLVLTLKCFYNHLNDNGIVIVEPWITPDNWFNGKVHMLTYDKDDIKICRMNISDSEGNLSILNFHYLIGVPNNEVIHFEERHELALYSKEEMLQAFKMAGFSVTHEEHGLIGRGMYFGEKQN